MFAILIAGLFNLVALIGLVAAIGISLVRVRHRLAAVLAYTPPAAIRPPRAAVRAVLVPV